MAIRTIAHAVVWSWVGMATFLAALVCRPVAYYLHYCLSSGDYRNDWLTHLPDWMQPTMELIGHAVALIGGG